MDDRPRDSVPLTGALLVAEGIVTHAQLEACLLLQAQDHPDMGIGQILVRCGYSSDDDLSRILSIQHDLTTSILDVIDSHTPRPADLTALMLHSDNDQQLPALLKRLGVSMMRVSSWAELCASWEQQSPDLVMINPLLLDGAATLPEQTTTPVVLLPYASFEQGHAPERSEWATALISRSVAQVREQRRQRQALEHLQQRESELSVVTAMSRSIAAARSPHEAISRLMITIRNLFDVEAGTLYRLDQATNQLVFEVVFGPYDQALYQQCLSTDHGIAGWVVRNGEPVLIPDVRRDPRFEHRFDHQTGFQTRSVLCVPLIAMGEVRGVLQLINKLSGEFNERDLLLLRIVAALGGLADMLASQMVERQFGS